MEKLKTAVERHTLLFIVVLSTIVTGAYILTGASRASELAVIGTLDIEVSPNPSNAGYERVIFTYAGSGSYDLSGAVLSSESGVVHTFAAVAVADGGTLELCEVEAPGCDIVWSGGEAWNNTSDTVTLTDEAGNTVFNFSYNNPEVGQAAHDTINVLGLVVNNNDKIPVCHAGPNGWQAKSASVSSLINGTGGHNAHPDDIIPPFTYQLKKQAGSFPGQNWDYLNQGLLQADCVE